MKKVIALILCLLMLLPLIVSCGSEEKSGEKQLSITDSVGSESHVPEDLAFVGEEFTILCREDNAFGDYLYEIVADEGETDLVNQAVYERNRSVMDTFGLSDIVAKDIPGDWNNNESFINTMRNSIDAGIGDFDLVMSQQGYLCLGELVQYFYNYHDIPYVTEALNCEEHEHDYYYPDIIDELTINGKLKYMVGDYCLTYWDHIYVLYFNKLMAEEYQLENIYDLVREGKWTMDKMLEMTNGKWKDLNNDDWPGSEDSYGYTSELLNPVSAIDTHFDIYPTHRDANGVVTVEYDVGKMTNILTKMLEFKSSNDSYFLDVSSTVMEENNPCDKVFSEGRALFYHATLEKAQVFRSMKTDFGIVPYPKWDDNQQAYKTLSQNGYSVACVPVDAPNLELTGAVFDTLSAISKETVIPAYYDKALTFKLTRDEESAEMLDIIREGFSMNFGKFYDPCIGCGKALRDTVYYDNPNFASFYATNLKGYQRKLEILLRYYED